MDLEIIELKKLNKSITELNKLIKHLIAIELYQAGATQDEIVDNIGGSKSTINRMLLGIRKKAELNEETKA